MKRGHDKNEKSAEAMHEFAPPLLRLMPESRSAAAVAYGGVRRRMAAQVVQGGGSEAPAEARLAVGAIGPIGGARGALG